jgi:LacI family transcriptional regulator
MTATDAGPSGTARTGTATIAEIAAELGVSVPTVSKVLNGRPDVSARTRAKVEAALDKHHYRRRRTRTNGVALQGLVELVFHQLPSIWSVEIIRGVEEVLGPQRASIVLSSLDGAHRPRQEWLDDVLARRPLGVILVLSDLSAEQRHQLDVRSIPYVVVDTAGDAAPGVPTVGSQNWNGGLVATRHLLSLGHRRIGVVAGPTDLLCSRARVDGYRTAHDEARVPIEPALIRYGEFALSDGYRQGLEILASPDRPTAVFACSDMQALGIMRAAHELGLRVPEDLSVVGYDDIPVSGWFWPPLTTVRQPLREMAGTAARIVLDLARGVRPANLRVDLATELVIRHSTTTPPGSGGA